MPIPSFFVPPRAVASVEQIRASLAAAREALPTLQQETVAAGMALAAELALDPNRQRIHARDQGMDMGALQRANSLALAKLRDQQDQIAAMEAALPFAVERERREQAAATVKSDNIVRETGSAPSISASTSWSATPKPSPPVSRTCGTAAAPWPAGLLSWKSRALISTSSCARRSAKYFRQVRINGNSFHWKALPTTSPAASTTPRPSSKRCRSAR